MQVLWLAALTLHCTVAPEFGSESLGQRQHIPTVKTSKNTQQAKYKQDKQTSQAG